MTIVVSCNLPDGILLGVDQGAIALTDDFSNIINVFVSFENLFRLWDKPIGVATYGLGYLDKRSIGSYIHQFQIENEKFSQGEVSIEAVVNKLRDSFYAKYFAMAKDVKDKLNTENPLILGFVVAGFSERQYLSEVWQIEFSRHQNEVMPVQKNGLGVFGDSILGVSDSLMEDLRNDSKELMKGRSFSTTEMTWGKIHVQDILGDALYRCKVEDTSLNIGGKAKIGMATYSGEPFKIVDIYSAHRKKPTHKNYLIS